MACSAAAYAAPRRPLPIIAAILVLIAVTAVPSKGEEVSARDTDSSSGGGFGSFLRRLMLDIVSWLGSLLGFGAERHAGGDADYPGGRGGRFPARGFGSRRPTASPKDVEDVPSENAASSQKPEFTSEEDLGPGVSLVKDSDAARGRDASRGRDDIDALVDSSVVELLEGASNLRGRAKGGAGGAGGASAEEVDAGETMPIAPERVTE